MSFLSLQNIHVTFPLKKRGLFTKKQEFFSAVNGVSFEVKRGEILGLVGESGCGKSTLSKVIMQLRKPKSGKIILNGEDLSTLSGKELRKRRLDFQMVFQDPYASLNPRYTILSTLSEALHQRYPKLKKENLFKAVQMLMLKVGLSPAFCQKYPHEFSGGQRQRIAIARALAPAPKLIIADEPVSALDVSIQSQILNLLKDLVKEMDLTMIFISHDLSVVHYMADNIAVMHQGEIVEYGSADQIFHHPNHPYTQKLLQAIPQIKTTSN